MIRTYLKKCKVYYFAIPNASNLYKNETNFGLIHLFHAGNVNKLFKSYKKN